MAPPLIEICVESLSRAVAAERGGADRIELCADLASGGVTPNAELMREVRRRVRIPIHVLIRPSSKDDFCSDSELETMQREISLAKELGMDGVVLGVLEKTLQVDRKRTSTLVKLAEPLPVTFHRAFDLCSDLPSALEAVIKTGAQRILTSGGKARISDGLAAAAALVSAAQDRIAIMPGGGVRAGNVQRILQSTGAREIHTSLVVSESKGRQGSRRPGKRSERDAAEFEARVRKFVQVVQAGSPRAVCPG
jgi:copper homeostasis protein